MSDTRIPYVRATGRTVEEMREEVQKSDLPRRGGCVLVWVNEGDLAWLGSEQVAEWKDW